MSTTCTTVCGHEAKVHLLDAEGKIIASACLAHRATLTKLAKAELAEGHETSLVVGK